MKLKDMGSWLAKEMQKAEKVLKDQVNFYSLNFVRTVVSLTPVDTSKAVSNWRLDIIPISGDIAPHAYGNRGSTAAQSRSVAIALAEARLATRTVGETIYIINHTPYIADLEQGKSRQQPTAGWIQSQITDFFTNLSRVG